jgi:hypothetical protein
MEREKQLSEILSNFYDLSVENQIEIFSDTCFSMRNLTKTIKSSNIINRKIILFLSTQLFWKFLIIHQMNRPMNNLLLKIQL